MKIGFRKVVLACLALSSTALSQSTSPQDLQKAVEDLQGEVKALRAEIDQLRAGLQSQAAARPTPIVIDVAGSPSRGDVSAKVVLIEFSDYQCPYCMDYFSRTYPQLIADYVKTGKVRYIVRDFPGENIHPFALKAAEGARCAGEQGKFWEMHDYLFNNQKTLPTTAVTDGAKSLGLKMAEFQTCFGGDKYVAEIRKEADEIKKLGAQGTPAFVFGIPDPENPAKVKLAKALVGSQTYTTYQQIIDALLGK